MGSGEWRRGVVGWRPSPVAISQASRDNPFDHGTFRWVRGGEPGVVVPAQLDDTHARQCSRIKRDGAQCKQWALVGQRVCKFHGGRHSLAEKAKAQIQHDRMMRTYLGQLKIETGADPAHVIMEEIARTHAVVLWLEDQVAQLRSDELIWVRDEETESTVAGQAGTITRHQHRLNVWVESLQKERAHLVRTCQVAIQAGLAERQIRVAEAQGALVATVIRGVLGELGLSKAQWALVQNIVPKHLRQLKELAEGPSQR